MLPHVGWEASVARTRSGKPALALRPRPCLKRPMAFPRRVALLALCCLAVIGSPASSHRASGAEGELLYNGIRLPQAWPPRDEVDPKSRHPAPVSYLAAPPAV